MGIRPGLGKMITGPPTAIGLGLSGPEWIEAPYDSPDSDLPYVVTLRAVYSEDRYVVEKMGCSKRDGGPPVTGEGIRQLPVGALLTYAVVGSISAMNQDVFTGERPVRPRVGDDETLAYVAKLYRFAYVAQEDPARAVMQNLDLPRATAGRWIRRARDGGFLSDAAPHRPKGEDK